MSLVSDGPSKQIPGLQPDMVLMNSIIAAAGRAGNLTLARETYQEALDAGGVAQEACFRVGLTFF